MDYVSIPSSTEALFAEFWGQSGWRELSDSAICSCTWDFSILQFSLHYHSGLVWPLLFPHNCFIFSISLLSQMYLGHIPTSRYGGCQLIKTPLSHWKYYFYFVRFFLAVTTRIKVFFIPYILSRSRSLLLFLERSAAYYILSNVWAWDFLGHLISPSCWNTNRNHKFIFTLWLLEGWYISGLKHWCALEFFEAYKNIDTLVL